VAGAYIIPPLGQYDSAVEIIRQLADGTGGVAEESAGQPRASLPSVHGE